MPAIDPKRRILSRAVGRPSPAVPSTPAPPVPAATAPAASFVGVVGTAAKTGAPDATAARDLELVRALGAGAATPARLANKAFVLAALAEGVLVAPAPQLLADRDVVRALVDAGAPLPEGWRKDRALVLAALPRRGVHFEQLSSQLKDDPAVAAAALRAGVARAHEVGPRLRQHKDVVLALAATNATDVLTDPAVKKAFGADPDVVAAVLTADVSLLPYLSLTPALLDDTRVATALAKEAFHLVPPPVRAREDVALAAVSKNADNLALLPRSLTHDRGFVAAAALANPRAAVAPPAAFRDDRALAVDVLARAPQLLGSFGAAIRDDEALVLPALARGAALTDASPRLQGHRDAALTAMRAGGPLEHVPPLLRADREIVTAAVRANGRNLAAVPHGEHDDVLVDLALKSDAHAARFVAPDRLGLHDPRAASDAIRRWGLPLYEALPPAVRAHPDVLRAVVADTWDADALSRADVPLALVPADAARAQVERFGDALMAYVNAGVLELTKDLAHAAVRADPTVLDALPQELKSDPDIARAQWTCWPAHRHRIPKAVRDDEAFLLRLAHDDVLALDCDGAARERVFAREPQLADAWREQRAPLDALGVFHAHRFTQAARAELVANRTQPRADDDERPAAVVILPRSDDAGAIAFMNLDDLFAGHRVLVYEVATKAELLAALADVDARGEQATLTVIGGHGRADLLALSGDDPAHAPVEKLDGARLLARDDDEVGRALATVCAPGSDLVLASCFTGEDGARGDNLANAAARWVPHAHVTAPMVSSNARLELDDDGRFARAAFFTGNASTHRVEPR